MPFALLLCDLRPFPNLTYHYNQNLKTPTPGSVGSFLQGSQIFIPDGKRTYYEVHSLNLLFFGTEKLSSHLDLNQTLGTEVQVPNPLPVTIKAGVDSYRIPLFMESYLFLEVHLPALDAWGGCLQSQ